MYRKHKPIQNVSSTCSNLKFCNFLRQREMGGKNKVGASDQMAVKLYDNYDRFEHKQYSLNGAICAMDYNTNGHLLAAACEFKTILLFDATNQKMIKAVFNAHNSCVNSVKFMKEHTFATCSDDKTVKLWDVRNLNRCTTTLTTHTNWVKSLDYCSNNNFLISSGFDGLICVWDISNSGGELYDKLYLMSGLMRTILSPDGSRLVISTSSGFLILVHNLNLNNFVNELRLFRPYYYHEMQRTHILSPIATNYNYLFHPNRNENHVELVDDFPNNADVISCGQIHPYGWVVASRNVSPMDQEEWTSVHDIQKRAVWEYEEAFSAVEDECFSPEEGESSEARERRRQDRYGMQQISPNANPSHPEYKNRMFHTLPRLTHYIQEENVAKGYIKELCFSPDGRVICSPYGNGFRFLGFSDTYQELSHCLPAGSKPLSVLLEFQNCHQDVVVSSRFNPQHPQLVTGCLSGDIAWYKPVL